MLIECRGAVPYPNDDSEVMVRGEETGVVSEWHADCAGRFETRSLSLRRVWR
jgi:hypothetical protein